jgi:hypothetical protein
MLETKHPPHPVNKEPPQLLRPRVGTWLTPREQLVNRREANGN